MKPGDVIFAVGLPGLAAWVVVAARRRTLTRRELARRLERADALAGSAVRLETSLERRRLAREIDALVRADVERTSVLIEEARRHAFGTDQRLLAVLEDVRAMAEETLAALGQLLGAIDPVEPGQDDAEVPSLPDELAALRSLGVAVERTDRGDPSLTPPGALVATSRLLRQALAGQPAVAGSIRLRLDHRPNALEVRLSARGHPPPALSDPEALVALRERVRLHGGTFRAWNGLSRWRMRATLPSGTAAGAQLYRWRPAMTDAALVAGTSALLLLDMAVLPADRPRLGTALGLVTVALPLAVRRRAPLTVCIFTGVGLIVGAATGALPHGPVPPFFVLSIVPFAAASHAATVTRALAGAGFMTATAVAAVALRLPRPGWPTPIDLALLAGYGGLIGAAASFARHHHGRALALAIDEEELTERHPELVRGAVAAERRRVAHDLHDLVSHGVSLSGVLAGAAAAQARGGDRAAAIATLATLEGVSVQNQLELRRLEDALDLFADAPVTGLGTLDELAAQARVVGHAVSVDVHLEPSETLPPALVTCVDRVVKEALANARRHAGGPPTVVTVRADGEELRVDVRNAAPLRPSRGGGTGRGLVAMAERARDLGGRVDAGPSPDGGYRVTLWLPLGGSSLASPGRTRPVS